MLDTFPLLPNDRCRADTGTGTLGPSVDSPYHGQYALFPRLRFVPGTNHLLLGNGFQFSADDLSYLSDLPIIFDEVTLLENGAYCLAQNVGDNTQLALRDSSMAILGADYFRGRVAGMRLLGSDIVLVTYSAVDGLVRVYRVPVANLQPL